MNKNKITLAGLITLVSLTGCATGLQAPSFKESPQAFNHDFDKVWAASLDSLDEYSIDSSNKEMREISTKPIASTNAMGAAQQKIITVKISQARPYKVKVRALLSRTLTVSGGRGLAMTKSQTDDFSDTITEQKIIKAISDKLQ